MGSNNTNLTSATKHYNCVFAGTTTIGANYVIAESASNTIRFGFGIISGGEPTGTLVVVAYDDSHRMIGCKAIDISTATGDIIDSFSYNGTPDIYKVLFWDSLENLKPLCGYGEGSIIKQ